MDAEGNVSFGLIFINYFFVLNTERILIHNIVQLYFKHWLILFTSIQIYRSLKPKNVNSYTSKTKELKYKRRFSWTKDKLNRVNLIKQNRTYQISTQHQFTLIILSVCTVWLVLLEEAASHRQREYTFQ